MSHWQMTYSVFYEEALEIGLHSLTIYISLSFPFHTVSLKRTTFQSSVCPAHTAEMTIKLTLKL